MKVAEVNKWKSRIDLAERWREDRVKEWRRLVGYLKNEFLDQVEDDTIVVNLVHSNVRVIIPSIYSQNPETMVSSRLSEFAPSTHTVKEVLDYEVKEIGLKKEVKRSILDAVVIGHGWVKYGWQTELEDYSEDAKTMIQGMINRIKSLMSQNGKKNTTSFAEVPDQRITSQSPWVLRTSPFNMIVPAYSQDPNTLPWIAERIIRPVADARMAYKKNGHKIEPSTNAVKLLTGQNPLGGEIDEDSGFAIMWEIWDARTNTFFTLCDSMEEPLVEPVDNPYSSFTNERAPYIFLAFNDITDEFYPMSDILPWEPQLLELSNLRTKMNRHVRRFNRKYVTRGLSEEQQTMLKEGEDGVCIPAEEDIDDARSVVFPIQDAPLAPDVYALEDRVKNDIITISRISDYQRGSAARGADTATEAAIIESASRLSTGERVDTVEEFVTAICRSLSQLCLRYLSAADVAKIVGKLSAVDWPGNLTDSQIKKEFLFSLVSKSTIPTNPEVERAQFKELYSVTANDPIFDPIKFRLELLRKYGIKDPENWLDQKIGNQLREMAMEKARMSLVLGPDGKPAVGGSQGRASELGATPQLGDLFSGERRPGGRGGGSLIQPVGA